MYMYYMLFISIYLYSVILEIPRRAAISFQVNKIEARYSICSLAISNLGQPHLPLRITDNQNMDLEELESKISLYSIHCVSRVLRLTTSSSKSLLWSVILDITSLSPVKDEDSIPFGIYYGQY